MQDKWQDESRFHRYLLGQLSEDEQILVEQEYFASDQSFEQLLALEDELTYRWLSGDLAPAERIGFERRFLSTETGKRHAEFARALESMGAKRYRPRWRPVWAALAAAAMLLFVSAMLFRQNRELRTQLAHVVTPQPITVAFLLTPGLTRGTEELRRIEVPAQADVLRLEMTLRRSVPPGATFRAALHTADGREVWSQGGLSKPIVEVPARILLPDEYDLLLQSVAPTGTVDDLGGYHFALSRR